MTTQLAGKIVVVTGGASGIGAACIEQLRAAGAVAVAADLGLETGALGEAGGDLKIDVSDPASVETAFDTVTDAYGRVDAVVNSAGIAREQPFLDTPLDAFDRIIAVNLRGSFIVGQAAARRMIASGGGSIVNIGSVSGLLGNAGRTAYGASKGGVTTLSKVMAVELASKGVRVNVVAPGPVETPLVAQVHSAETRADWGVRVPAGRYGEPDEIAAAVLFLVSDASSYVTGHVLAVDGGFMAQGLRSQS